ncbi:thiaminase II [Paenibacillus cymbidii]|uniref:thiaminase II n=1 Tax=Paenibacillus cymbidii TaxID=1639034 RepID=UPI001081752A|nr:thiaminase II [Paenibacillus cymbidii]
MTAGEKKAPAGFCGRLRAAAEPVWRSSHEHPFLTGLRDGTLPAETFAFYMRQDYVYLIDYAKLFALGAIKADDLVTMAKFAGLLDATLGVEMELHRRYAARFGIAREQLEATKPSPTTVAYTHYMLGVAHNGSLAELTAVLLPCMWSYHEIGCTLAQTPGASDHPLYGEWIRTYAAHEFGELVEWLIALMERLAEGQPEARLARLEELFLQASRFEYMFWDMAYRGTMWPV